MKRIEITSAHNPLIKQLRKTVQDNAAYRKTGQIWLEGDHLCRALLTRGGQVTQWVAAASYEAAWRNWAEFNGAVLNGAALNIAARNGTALNTYSSTKLDANTGVILPVADVADVADVAVLDDTLMDSISSLESAAKVGALINLPAVQRIDPTAPTVVLDRVQDAGNVGAILRCASAFGFKQILAIKGTAALWSPKVLRSSMGAHFALQLHEGLSHTDLSQLAMPLLLTSSHQGDYLHEAALPNPCAWVLGHEGQGVSAEIAHLASRFVRIAQPGGEESLNVASAAAICLYSSSVAR